MDDDDGHYATLIGHTVVRATDTIDRPPTLHELEQQQAETGRADVALTKLQHARIHSWATGGHGHCSRSGSSRCGSATGSTSSRNRSISDTKSNSSSMAELKDVAEATAEEKMACGGARISSDERCDLLSPLPDVSSYTGSRSPSPGSPQRGSSSMRTRADSVGSDPGEAHPAITGNPAFFHGPIPRDVAEQRLLGTPPGSYLVREKKFDRIYALTLHVGNNRVQHHLIERSVRRDGSPGSHFVFNSQRLRDCHSVEQVLARIVSGDCTCAIALGKPVVEPSCQQSEAVNHQNDGHSPHHRRHHHHHHHHQHRPSRQHHHHHYHHHHHHHRQHHHLHQSEQETSPLQTPPQRKSRSHSGRRPSSAQTRAAQTNNEYDDRRQQQPKPRARRPRAATAAPTIEFCV